LGGRIKKKKKMDRRVACTGRERSIVCQEEKKTLVRPISR
jgi:hypothetical protein